MLFAQLRVSHNGFSPAVGQLHVFIVLYLPGTKDPVRHVRVSAYYGSIAIFFDNDLFADATGKSFRIKVLLLATKKLFKERNLQFLPRFCKKPQDDPKMTPGYEVSLWSIYKVASLFLLNPINHRSPATRFTFYQSLIIHSPLKAESIDVPATASNNSGQVTAVSLQPNVFPRSV